jgi:CRP-like cAMP-binding protein
MYETLFKYLNNHTSVPLTASELEMVKGAFTPMKISKRQYLLREGEICKHFAFVVKGAMRQYLVDEKGVQHFVQLGLENWWVGDRESWIMLTPSVYCIDAWEDSELLLITRADMVKLVHDIPGFNEMVRLLDDRNKIATQKRITSSISFSAEKRYADFISCNPDFLKRFPQHIIASYLGITKETLSRIRKQALLK